MNNDYARISIITPSYNQGQYIEQTIDSVLSQNYPNLEYIIIDGGSTDNTIEIIKKYEKHLKYWVSEKDNGQASAINKGLKYCTGDVFNWLNSDDYINERSLELIGKTFSDKSIQLLAGAVNVFSSEKNEVVLNQNLTAPGLMRWDKGVHFVQPGVWMRKSLVSSCGGIDEQFHYSFDWDLLIRYLFLYPNVKYLTDVIVNFRLHDQSKTISSNDKFTNEEKLIIEKINSDILFKNLHPVCKWKISRTEWSEFLMENICEENLPKWKRVSNIVSHINKQPFDIKIGRMTLGAIKQILLQRKR